MASLSSITTIILLLLFLNLTLSLSSSSSPVPKSPKPQKQSKTSLIDDDQGEPHKPSQNSPPFKKKPILDSPKNQTKLKKTNSTTTLTHKGATFKPSNTTTNNNKLTTTITTTKPKLNKTLNASPKPSNSTKILKPTNSTKIPPPQSKPLHPSKPTKAPPLPHQRLQNQPKPHQQSMASAEDADLTGGDLMADFRDLLPDLERLSTTSKAYISAANRGIADGVKPLVGNTNAAKVAPFLSSALLAAPLLLLAAAFRRLRASHLALHRLLIFIQAYLAIYFATLALAALATGLEPLRFLFNASPASYTWTQAVQTLAYLLYLVVQLLDLVAVFSDEGEDAGGAGGPARASALVQMVIGLGVGVHYYAAVFHRAVNGEAPRANWRVHAVYATCFVVICWCARAHRRKKIYEGEEDGKKS